MSIDVLKSDLFTPWIDPETGVTSYILSKKVAPVQETFYFVNDCMSRDGRYLWFYCAFPPSGTARQGRTLGLIDFELGEIRHFPETQFNHSTPYVDPDNGWVYWGMGDSLWRRGPELGDEAEHVNSLPEDLLGHRPVHRFATHLTRSADGKAFFVDAAFGLQWVFGSMPIDGSDYQIWHRFDRNFNHAQFSPTDPDLVLFAQENHPDPLTGLRFRITDRMWLMRRGEAPRPVFDTPTVVTHEWWELDGQHVWCIKSREGTWRVNIETQHVEKLSWPQDAWHSHNHASNNYVISDTNTRFYRGCPSTVQFLNCESRQHIRVIDNPEMPGHIGKSYHIDPHPRFVGDGQLIVFTTTVRGTVDLAIAQTSILIDRTS